jgi:hypothetical protein
MLDFFNRRRPAIPADQQPGRNLITPTPLTLRLRHIGIELGKLSAIQPRPETTRGALDFWLDRRLTLRPGGEGGSRRCETCEQEVRRGEAYSEQPGTGGLIQHVHCPEREEQP